MRWQAPTLRQFADERAADPRALVVFGERPSGERAAGVAAVQTYPGAAPTWGGEPGTFTGDSWGGAYWMVGTTLYVSSGARVYADMRAELSIPAPSAAVARIPAMQWATELLEDLGQKARAVQVAAGRTFSNPTMDFAVVTREWLRVLLWYTYHRNLTPRIDAVRLPRDLLLPAFGARLGTPDALTGAFAGFALNASNAAGFEATAFMGPFVGGANAERPVVQGPGVDITGAPPAASSGMGGDSLGALFALAGVALLAGEDK